MTSGLRDILSGRSRLFMDEFDEFDEWLYDFDLMNPDLVLDTTEEALYELWDRDYSIWEAANFLYG